jgi:hypothetical protein
MKFRGPVEGVWGNREVSAWHPWRLRQAVTERKGFAGKHGFPRVSTPKAGEGATG